MKKNSVIALLAFLILTFLAGSVGSIFTSRSVNDWYVTLYKPPFNPPARVFAPVWSLLYFMIALSVWIVWMNRGNPHAKTLFYLFGIQLFLNILWTFLFFGLRLMGWAFIDIIALIIIVGTYALYAWNVSKIASLLFFPYWLWLLFAGYLNILIWLMNR